MSRLDRAIVRMVAQRACLDHAAALIRDIPGPALELGLGNGRTYDHLRARLDPREIFVFERQVAAHPGSLPPGDHLILGDLRQTLPPLVRRFAAAAAFAHIDIATGDTAASLRLVGEVVPLLAPLLRPGAVVASELAAPHPGWRKLPLPAGVAPERYHLYRVEDGQE